MKNNKVKQIAVLSLAFTITAGISLNARADGTSNIQSKGSFQFKKNGDIKIVLDSSDLTKLETAIKDEMIEVENGKKSIKNSLNGIGTYFTSDGSITHDSSQSDDNYLPTFNDLGVALARSQEVDFTGCNPINENNLSLGTAGWVNGRLIIGNGADNLENFRQGYCDGYASAANASVQNVTYHKHLDGNGNVVNNFPIYSTECPGGCITCGSHTHNATGECPTHVETISVDHGIWTENVDIVIYDCGFYDNTWIPSCGKTTKTIESIEFIYP